MLNVVRRSCADQFLYVVKQFKEAADEEITAAAYLTNGELLVLLGHLSDQIGSKTM